MKKIILIIAFVVAPLISYSQSIFDDLEDMDDVSSVIVNKDAFEILSKFNVDDKDNEAMQTFKMIQNLNEFKVFSSNNESVANTMEKLVKRAVKNKKLTELMRAKDKGSRVKIYVKATNSKDIVSEVLMFVKNKDDNEDHYQVTIVSLTGKIDVNKLSKLADTYNGKKNK